MFSVLQKKQINSLPNGPHQVGGWVPGYIPGWSIYKNVEVETKRLILNVVEVDLTFFQGVGEVCLHATVAYCTKKST